MTMSSNGRGIELTPVFGNHQTDQDYEIDKDYEIDNEFDLERDARQQDEHSPYVWLTGAYHLLVAIIGTGILGFPMAFSYLGFVGGTVTLVLITISSIYTAMLLIGVQEQGQKSYSDIADSIMGTRFSNRWVKPFQLLGFFPTTCVMLLIGGQSIFSMERLSGTDVLSSDLSICIVGIAMILLAFVPDLSSGWMVSMIGALSAILIPSLCIVGATIAFMGIQNGEYHDPPHNRPVEGDLPYAFGILSSIGSLIFGYGYHSILPDVQYSLRDKNSHDAHVDTRKAVRTSVGIAFPAYLMVATLGYAAFGNQVTSDVFDSLSFVLGVDAMYFAYGILAFKTVAEGALYNQVAFRVIEDLLFEKSNQSFESLDLDDEPAVDAEPIQDDKPKQKCLYCKWTVKMISRIAYVGLAVVIAITLPLISDLSSITGAIGVVPLTFVLPVIFWNRKNSQTASAWRICFHYVLATVLTIVAISALVGSIYDIAVKEQFK